MYYDIVIIGGGISGINICYQILKKTTKLKLLLVEKNDYFGGRILTSKFNKDLFDAGAGRIAGHHERTVKLLNELNLWEDKFKISSKSLLILKTLTDEEKKIHKNYPSFESIFNLLLEKIEKNIKLENFTLLDLVKKYLGMDYSTYLQKIFEYDSELSFMNAKESIKNLKDDFTGNKDYYVLKQKNCAIIESLIDKIKDKIDLELKTELVSISKDNLYYNLELNHKGNIKNICCENVILALDKSGLNKLDYLCKYKEILKFTQPRPLYRVYAKYTLNEDGQIWFKHCPKIITDLPIKFIIPVNKNSGVIMITYTDGRYTDYWKTQFNKGCFEYSLRRDLKSLFPNTKFGDIKWISHYFWDNGGHYWIPGVDVDNIIDQIRNPEENLFIIGEVVSRHQAWIEGGLECEDVLKKLKVV